MTALLRVEVPGVPPSTNKLKARRSGSKRVRDARTEARRSTVLAMLEQGWRPPWFEAPAEFDWDMMLRRQLDGIIKAEALWKRRPRGADGKPFRIVVPLVGWRAPNNDVPFVRFVIRHVVKDWRGDPHNRDKVVLDGVCDALGIDDRKVVVCHRPPVRDADRPRVELEIADDDLFALVWL